MFVDASAKGMPLNPPRSVTCFPCKSPFLLIVALDITKPSI